MAGLKQSWEQLCNWRLHGDREAVRALDDLGGSLLPPVDARKRRGGGGWPGRGRDGPGKLGARAGSPKTIEFVTIYSLNPDYAWELLGRLQAQQTLPA